MQVQKNDKDELPLQREEFSRKIRRAINNWEKERLIEMVMMARESGFSPIEIVNDMIFPELLKACSAHNDFYLSFSELLLIADTVQGAVDLLIPEIKALMPRDQTNGVVVIGTVQGDIHELGKNLVAAVFQSGGYQVVDVGHNAPLDDFISVAKKEKADVVAISAMMSTTLVNVRRLIMMIKEHKLGVKTIIGGLATSAEFAREIGADAWAGDALKGLDWVRNFLKKRNEE